jgi:LytS/YehU family sensor histidine kinase
LTALKAQLQPHFLFNTLNMILPLTYRDPDTASRMLVLLGDLLRASLERDATTLIPLREELEFLQKYLEIQRARFAQRLEVRFDVDEGVLEAPIPSLLLQPLVENAIKHGISKHRGDGRIDISCRRDQGFLALTVWNTAGGDAEGPADHSHGIGLSNIQERLDLIYRFSREASPEGFRVVIRLPLQTSAPTANGAESRRARGSSGTPAPASERA